ncbi:MAG TPA: DUF2637 domain-containing protein [Trebonia sp.]|nr:DUF2637 domain-containing protein [Trebonia sp.]
MNGDKAARMLAGLAVLTVAVIAAIVSFSHIETLALSHGQPIWDARFLPVSVDGMLVVSSLTLLADARARRPAPGLARAGLVLGVVATVAANVVFGVHAGPVGAVISAWPAVAFIVATEILVGQMRRAGGIPSYEDTAKTVAAPLSPAVPPDAPQSVPVATVSPAPVGTQGTVADGEQGVPGGTPVTPVSVPQDGPESVPPSVAAPVPRVVPGASLRRSPKRAPAGRPKSAEKVFRAELAAGQVPSLRQVKERMHVGTPRARAILADLQAITESVAA